MRIFISGGCKNGKSSLAQRLAVAQRQPDCALVYVATMYPGDDEDRQRIARHRQERAGMGFRTVEQPREPGRLCGLFAPGDSLMLDSLTAWLSNEMFTPDGIVFECLAAAERELEQLFNHFENLVIVSDYLYGDGGSYDADTERYRSGLAALDRLCATRCDAVLELSGGIVTSHKGGELLEAFV